MRTSSTVLARAVLALVLTASVSGCDILSLFAEGGVEFRDVDQQQVAPGPEVAVPLDVQDGPDGGTLVFVPVYFGNRGPYSFALDTGASHSIIDEKVVEDVGLAFTGETRALAGVGGTSETKQVHVGAWRIGDVVLSPRSVASTLMAAGDLDTLRGLLGSDILHDFERVTIDYDQEVLLLHPKS